MNRLYKATPDGYCGDEDNGQTSAWYVFSALGFYPVCPGTDQYVLGAPLFKKATLRLENGKTFTITAPANSEANRYVKAVQFNGKNWNKNWISHFDLMAGGSLNVSMSATPEKSRGTDKAAYPYSFSVNK